jgi:hypothetical protein
MATVTKIHKRLQWLPDDGGFRAVGLLHDYTLVTFAPHWLLACTHNLLDPKDWSRCVCPVCDDRETGEQCWLMEGSFAELQIEAQTFENDPEFAMRPRRPLRRK